MKKMFALLTVFIVAICALTVISFTYDTSVDVVYAGGEVANGLETNATEDLICERQDYPAGLNEEKQYDIIAVNGLYGHNDYGDYVPAETRYINGFPVVNGVKTNNRYYGCDPYVYPGEEEKPYEDWNLYDFHDNGEFLESEGNGTYVDINASAHDKSDENSSSTGNNLIDSAQNTVDNVNEKQSNIQDIVDSME